ncbi:MAG: hypothetical protein IH956_00280 [Chloroflexi bacterium]|nr:hypothetical protein [Chloroflexota bacterium]
MNGKLRKQPKKAEQAERTKPRRTTPKGSLTQIAEIAVRQFTENPSAFWGSFPKLANAIELHLQSTSGGRKRVPVFEGYMTERERESRLRKLSETVDQYKTSGTLEPEQARRALELAALLREDTAPYRETLLKMAQHILGVPLDSEKPQKVRFLRGKAEHHTFELVRGVTLSLAWDGQLISLRLDPKEYQYRRKALSMVGIGRSGQRDVSVNHDSYLWDDRNG